MIKYAFLALSIVCGRYATGGNFSYSKPQTQFYAFLGLCVEDVVAQERREQQAERERRAREERERQEHERQVMAAFQLRQQYLAQLANQPQPPAIQRREHRHEQLGRNGTARRRLNFENA